LTPALACYSGTERVCGNVGFWALPARVEAEMRPQREALKDTGTAGKSLSRRLLTHALGEPRAAGEGFQGQGGMEANEDGVI
jgi:hypothetical protein